MVPQLIKDIFLTVKANSSLILGIVSVASVALTFHIFFRSRRLKRLANENALHLKEIELRYLNQPPVIFSMEKYTSSLQEEPRKRERLAAEISYYKKLLGKKDT